MSAKSILCMVVPSVLLSSQARADLIEQPVNTVPADLVGTWKALNYAESGASNVDFNAARVNRIVGKTFQFSPTALTAGGENKCAGSFYFLLATGKDSGSSEEANRILFKEDYKYLFAKCKDNAGKLLTENSMRNMKADYGLNRCSPPPSLPDKWEDLPIGFMVIDDETVVGSVDMTYFCMKRVLPKATLSGAPAVASKLTALNVTVGGSNIATYQYAVVPGSTCDGATYSTEFFPLTTKITASLGADGPYTLCVKGKSAVTDMQRVPTQKSWTKDTVAPTQVTLTGTPANPSSTANLNVTVGGDGVTKYRAALKNGTGCTGVTYGAATVIATPITLAVGAAGPKTLCVKGLDAAGNLQTTPTQYSWTQN